MYKNIVLLWETTKEIDLSTSFYLLAVVILCLLWCCAFSDFHKLKYINILSKIYLFSHVNSSEKILGY